MFFSVSKCTKHEELGSSRSEPSAEHPPVPTARAGGRRALRGTGVSAGSTVTACWAAALRTRAGLGSSCPPEENFLETKGEI